MSEAISSPAPNGGVLLGHDLVVNITAADNAQISRVSASFDIDGNGVVDAGDAVTATQTGANTYQAVFPSVSGPSGTRAVRAIAWDSSSNTNLAAITVNVSNTIANPCDPNQDASTNVADVQFLIDQALGLASATGDLNGSGAVNVVDIQVEINAVLYSTCVAH